MLRHAKRFLVGNPIIPSTRIAAPAGDAARILGKLTEVEGNEASAAVAV